MEEQAPLLKDNERSRDYTRVKSLRDAAKVFYEETVKLWKIATPLVLNIIFQYSATYINNIFVGRYLGELYLSALTLSLLVVVSFASGVMLGMGSALETLCGQAYGAGQVHMLGIYMQRCWIILLLCGLALTPLYIFGTPILKLLGQDDDIANIAGQYTLLIIPQLLSCVISYPTQKFLQAQSRVDVLAWIGFVALIEHVFLLWVFVPVLGWGLEGVALAFNITGWVTAFAQLIYVFGWCKDAGLEFSWAAFKDMWGFVRLSVSSSFMICLEVWSIIFMTLLAGHLPNAVIGVGSLSICLNITGIQSLIFTGIRYAISVRVSNELGLEHARAAKYSVYVTLLQSLLMGVLCILLILVAGDYIVSIYTDSKELQLAVSNLTWLLLLSLLNNSVCPVILGVTVGGGWQTIVAYINLVCLYVVGLPLGYILGYVADYGVMGIWGGAIAGTILQILILSFIVYQTNWNTEVEETSCRVKRWGEKYINSYQARLN